MKRRALALLVAVLAQVVLLAHGAPLDTKRVPQFAHALAIPPVYAPEVVTDDASGAITHRYRIDASVVTQQILPPGLPATTLLGFGGTVHTADGPRPYRGVPGATLEATRHLPIEVTWRNNIEAPHPFPVDPSLRWADPDALGPVDAPHPPFPPGFARAQQPVPLSVHLHGGEVPSMSDGHPQAWFTATGVHGPTYRSLAMAPDAAVFRYPNAQQAATLWYHDHTLGMTRLNVVSGLFGAYLLRDPADRIAPLLPKGKYEIPLIIQDLAFEHDGSIRWPNVGVNPKVHPYWRPAVFGDTIVVNGKAWPNLDVERKRYRFRIVNGSAARFYNLHFAERPMRGKTPEIVQIGSDGGYLPSPVPLSSLLLGPGERADVLVDFSRLPAGSKAILRNDAKAPYPDGDPVDRKTTGRVMQFTVAGDASEAPRPLPARLNSLPALKADAASRVLALSNMRGPHGPIMALIDGRSSGAPVSEHPRVGSTEDWLLVNMTKDAHAMHLHLIQFQVIGRQAFEEERYEKDWTALNGEAPFGKRARRLAPEPYLEGEPQAPAPNERGWKDTVIAPPGTVTRIRARFAPQHVVHAAPGVNAFSFDPTLGPGYVYHCHVLGHADNGMMRPYRVVK